jgi:hypothetical protein
MAAPVERCVGGASVPLTTAVHSSPARVSPPRAVGRLFVVAPAPRRCRVTAAAGATLAATRISRPSQTGRPRLASMGGFSLCPAQPPLTRRAAFSLAHPTAKQRRLLAGVDRIAVHNGRHHAARMAKTGSPSYVAPDPPPRRVVVRASGLARRGYVWEIVHSDLRGNTAVERTSARSFRTMEAAFNDGEAALARWPKLPP